MPEQRDGDQRGKRCKVHESAPMSSRSRGYTYSRGAAPAAQSIVRRPPDKVAPPRATYTVNDLP